MAPRPHFELDLQVPLDRFDLDVQWSVNEPVIGLFGPSGSGKTTILESVAGLRPTARGRIRVGESVWLHSQRGISLPPERRDIGYVPQGSLLFPHWSVERNLRAGHRRACAAGVDFSKVFQEVVSVLDLASILDRSVDDLSGGERQRVALGRALCSGPRLLLLDEPLAALDAALRYRILPFLIRIREHFGIPMLVVSHQPTELQALCDRVFAIRDGRILGNDTPEALFSDPEIYPLARASGRYENLFSGRVETLSARLATVRVDSSTCGPIFHTLPVHGPVGIPVTLTLPASDVILTRQPIVGLSARNSLPGTIRAIHQIEGCDIVRIELDNLPTPLLTVELTEQAVEDLALAPNDRIHAIFKSSSIQIATLHAELQAAWTNSGPSRR